MPDELFENPRLAAVYDANDGPRDDLDHYIALIRELGATSVLDIGCGTGALAVLLAAEKVEVHAIDPAEAMLEVAKSRPEADRVTWQHGYAADLPALSMDVAIMTGNVAQVFLTDDDWVEVLRAANRSLRPGGYLIFETRDPAKRAWERWTRAQTIHRTEVAGVDTIEAWVDVIGVDPPYVTFEHRTRFESDGSELRSESTLRFRSRLELDASLDATGFEVAEVRDAPDRPGLEFVYVARRP